jgi:predicted nucleotidyltransferase component of viral defense system
MNEDLLEKIKKITLIALASDDYLMETLVLKGGNAIQMAYRINKRGSFDMDFSMESDFEDIEDVKNRIFRTLDTTFNEYEYAIFDFEFKEKPSNLIGDLQTFWGGYKVGFKICNKSDFADLKGEINYTLRNKAIPLNPKNRSPKLEIEISKFEYIQNKVPFDLDGYNIFIYAPEMIVFEKMRAICQQNDEYSEIINTKTQRERARDFYDIHTLITWYDVDILKPESKEMLKAIFAAKKVPLEYMSLVPKYKDRHESGFKTVQATILQSEKIESFDFYFDYVVNLFEELKNSL